MNGLAGLAAAVVIAALSTSCAADDDSAASDPEPTPPEAQTFEVSGQIKVDSLGGVHLKRNPDRCVASGDLGRLLNPGKSPVVITAPNGDEVALGKVTGGMPPTYVDKKDGQEYYSPGFCNFRFIATGVEPAPGVFTAAIPQLDLSARFEAGEAEGLVLKYDAY